MTDPAALCAWLARVKRLAFLVGAVGVALCVVGYFFNPRQAAFSYLYGYLFWTGVSLGSLALYMLHSLTGGRWGFVIRRSLEAAMATLPLAALLFIPFFFLLPQLYDWAQPDERAHNLILQSQQWYLNKPGFVLRTVVVWGVWLLMAGLLLRWSRAQDAATDPEPTRRMRTLSGPGIVVHAFIGTLAAVDWIMVLESDWYSTVFPPLFLISQMLTALAVSIIVLVFFRPALPWRDWVTERDFHSLGNLLMAFTLLWTYLMVAQLIIIWSGNLPREIVWYLHRSAGGWKIIAGLLIVCQFFTPFFLLLFRVNKRRPLVLAGIAIGILCVHLFETLWRVAPSLHREGFYFSWMDLCALVGIGGLWLAWFSAQFARRLETPRNDPRIAVSFAHAAHPAPSPDAVPLLTARRLASTAPAPASTTTA